MYNSSWRSPFEKRLGNLCLKYIYIYIYIIDAYNCTSFMDILVINNSITVVNLIALVGQEFRGTLEVGEVAYFVYDLPEEGFTVKVEVTEGYVVIYVSTQVSNPNEALHDFKLVTNTTASVFVPPPSSSTDRERWQLAPDSPANDTAKVYISVEGHSTMMNLFILNTTIPPGL